MLYKPFPLILHRSLIVGKIAQNLGSFDGVEVDVQVTKDDVVYICHDREVNGKAFSNYQADEIERLVKANDDLRNYVARFDQWFEYVVDVCLSQATSNSSNFWFFIEIKGKSANTKAILEQMELLFAKFKARLGNAKLCFISFHEEQIINLAKLRQSSKLPYSLSLLFAIRGSKVGFEANFTTCEQLPNIDQIRQAVEKLPVEAIGLDSRYIRDESQHDKIKELAKYLQINVWDVDPERNFEDFKQWQNFAKLYNISLASYTHDLPKEVLSRD
ncbi:MAG: glycerophosphodiester phosphodiesterase family protein [Proteobacteria bacterium]|nr:glycerophosphodiester phosphodiesterase family protein [Pseudomonadota bacterium]